MPDNFDAGDEFYLSEVSPKDKPWDVHRAFADKIQSLYSLTDRVRYAERIQRCAKLIGFALAATDEAELVIRLRSAHFCRCRHCTVCQWRRSLKWRAKFFQAMPLIQAAYPTYRWLFLTLTVKNCPLSELRSTLADMNKAFKRLSDLAMFPAIGWIKSVEVTRAENGDAHPHFHCLLLVPASYFSHAYVKQETWRETWQKCLRVDYLPMVNIKAVKGQKSANPDQVDDGIARAVCETLKYSVKADDLVGFSPEWLAELTEQLHKTRAIAIGGVLRNFIDDKPETNEDLINPDGESDSNGDDFLIWFGWREMSARYTKN